MEPMNIELADEIAIIWHIEDIIATAEDGGIELTPQQAREILRQIEHDYDASIGINWEVIQLAIDSYLTREENAND